MKVLGVGGGISGTNTSDAKRKGRNAQQQPGYVIWNHGFMSRPLPHPLRMLFLGLIKNQLEDQCQPMLISKPKHEPHSSWPFQTGRQEWGQKSQGYAESLTFTLPRAQEGTLCQICLKSYESLAPFLSGICWRPAYADMDGLVRYCQAINKPTFSDRTYIKQRTTA